LLPTGFRCQASECFRPTDLLLTDKALDLFEDLDADVAALAGLAFRCCCHTGSLLNPLDVLQIQPPTPHIDV
jgi:hypothetical protein